MASTPDGLRVGDYITLRNVKHDCFLAGEGILLEDLVICDSLTNIDEAVFCVHLQRQYSASIELDEFLKSYELKVIANNSDPNNKPLPLNIADCDDPPTEKYLHALKRCLYNEHVLNESYMKQKQGMSVVFGDIVQFFHVKSQKYLTITNDQLAKDERENMRIQLDSKGSPFSWCVLSPRYKIDKDGDRILTNTEMYLRVAERANEFVHCSDRELMPKIMDPRMNGKKCLTKASDTYAVTENTGMLSAVMSRVQTQLELDVTEDEPAANERSDLPSVREVNCSLESTSWKLNIYQSSIDRADKYLLLSSQLITIQDPETKSMLTVGARKVESLDEAEAVVVEDIQLGDGSDGGSVHTNDGDFFHEFGDIILVPQHGTHLDSNSLWVMESVNHTGGPVVWKTQHVHFRHINTNVYLVLQILELINSETGQLEEKYVYSTAADSSSPSALFQLHEMYAAKTNLGNMKPVQISQDGVFMKRGSVIDAGSDDKVQICYMIRGDQEKDNAISLILTRFTGGEEEEEDEAEGDKKEGGDLYDVGTVIREPLDVHVGIAARTYVQNFLDITTIPLSDNVATIWPGADSEDMNFFILLMQKINYFIQGFPISSSKINEDVDKADPKVRTKRQYQLQEQRILELILRIINKLIPISSEAVVIANLLKMNKTVSEDKINCNRMGQSVLKLCFDIIYSAIQEHPSNQMHIADFLPVLLAHLAVQPLAGKCVTEMLNKNMELQETKIGKREITIFINQLKEARMNSMYLGLLQSCCSCMGEGVDGNQRLVALMLFQGDCDMIIKVHPDYTRLLQIDWGIYEGNLYVPMTPVAGSPVMGEALFGKGLPQLSLTWTTNAIDYSPLGLFGKLSVPIEELYRRNGGFSSGSAAVKTGANKNSKLLAKKALSLEQKKSVADYFIAEMYLGAEMLMDRNYISLSKLSPLFHFDVLVTMLKMDVDDNLKAAAARLLMYLYIDTDPQLESTIPCLTRPWSEIAMNEIPKLPYVEPVRRHTFGLVQHMLSEHIRGLQGTRWTRLSLSMFEVLRMLVSFNFYGTMGRMNDIVVPLIVALDRRKIDYSKDVVDVPLNNTVKDADGNLSPSSGNGDLSMNSPNGTNGGADTRNRLRSMSTGNSLNMTSPDARNRLRSSSMNVSKTDTFSPVAEEVEPVELVLSKTTDSNVFMQTFGSLQGTFSAAFGIGEEEQVEEFHVKLRKKMKAAKKFIDGMPVMIFILGLVVVAVSLTIYETITGLSSPAMQGIQFFILAVFIIEVSTRYISYRYLYESSVKFFKSPYNIIDLIVIAIDLIFLGLPTNVGGAGKYARILRLIRLVRLVRLLRAVRVIAVMVDGGDGGKDKLISASRYTKSPLFELDAMVQAIEILLLCQANIEDRNVSLLLRYFYKWECGDEKRTPVELFNQVMIEADELALHSNESDDVFIDLIMFVHPPLVQRVLDVLMAHYTRRRVLLKNSANVQLLVSARRERQYKLIDQMLFQLDLNVETHELWGDLENDSMHATNKQTIDMLTELIDVCCIRRSFIDVDEIGAESNPDPEIQHLLRNLGCVSTCLKVVKLLEGVEEDEDDDESVASVREMSEASRNIVNLVTLGNKLLYWFFLDNKANQELGFAKLDTFIDILDKGVGADRVVYAIFRGNEKLQKSVTTSYINKMVDNICKEGRNPVFLTLLSSITNVGEKNFPENQYQVSKQMTDPAKQDKLSSYLTSVNSAEYAEKHDLMLPFKGKKNVPLTALPMELQYHVAYLRALASCTVGSMNTVIVEAKIQATFNHIDIVEAMNDPDCIIIVKIFLGLFYFNGIIDVAMEIPGLEHTACVWKLLESFPQVFRKTCKELENAANFGGIHVDEVDRQIIEYAVICARIIIVFFEKYYDPLMFAMMEDREEDDAAKFVVMTSLEADKLFINLFQSMKKIHDLDSSAISRRYKNFLVKAMQNIAEFTLAIPEQDVQAIGGRKPKDKEVAGNPSVSAMAASPDPELAEVEAEETHEVKDSDHMLERRIQKKYSEFLSAITTSVDIQEAQVKESLPFIGVIEELPFIKDKHIAADVRYESFIRKLVAHTRSKIEMRGGVEKHLDAQCTLTSIWILQAFRTTIENKWGMDIFQRDEDGGEEEDEASRELVDAFNNCGAVTLCLDLIAVGIDPALQTHCSFLGVAVLLREGGNEEVQKTIYKHLVSYDSELFFRQVQSTIKGLIAWHVWRHTQEEAKEQNAAESGAHAEVVGSVHDSEEAEDEEKEEEEEVELPEEIIMLRFLQLFCEGHYKPNQDILRHQPHNNTSINLLEVFVEYFKNLSLMPCRTSTKAAITVTNVLLEIIQGPCEKNQEYLVLSTELIETLNRVLRAKVIKDCDEDEEIELKKICIDIFQGLLEGQSLKGAVYERVFSVIHFDVIQTLAKSVAALEEEAREEMDELPDEDAPPQPGIEISEDESVLKTECMVLLEMLCNYRPSLRHELGMDEEKGGESHEDTGCIEVVWRGEVLRKFFHIPPICRHLAKGSKDQFVISVDRSNAENQMLDFVERGRVMHMEVKHQEMLIEMGLDKVFNRTYQEYATWFAFFLCCVINIIFLIYYHIEGRVEEDADNGVAFVAGTPSLTPEIVRLINGLNIVQLMVATFTLVMFLVVRAPVKYQVYEAEGLSQFENLFKTATDFQTLYYFGYCIVALLGIVHHDFWSTFLLLDLLMKNATARDVVRAVYNPFKQLGMSLILLVLVVYVYGTVLFFLFRTDLAEGNETLCYTLWDCFKACFDLGLRHVNYITELMNPTYEWRELLDLFGYLGIRTLLLNLVFGIIIESFKQLREENDEKVDKINNSCFMCGIDKETFDRSSDGVDGYKRHIKQDHLMWNYLYFFIFLWEQDKDDDDGLELYIRGCIERFDVGWFPIGKALVLNDSVNDDEALNEELADSVKTSARTLSGRIQGYQHEVSQVMEQLVTVLKNDSTSGGGKVVKKITRQIQLATGVGMMDLGSRSGPGSPNVLVRPEVPVGSTRVGGILANFGSPGRLVQEIRIEPMSLDIPGNKIPELFRAQFDANPMEFLKQLRIKVMSDSGVFSVLPKQVKVSKNNIYTVILSQITIRVGHCDTNSMDSKVCTIRIEHASASGGHDSHAHHDAHAHALLFAYIEIPLIDIHESANTCMDVFFDAGQTEQKSRKSGMNRSLISLIAYSDEIDIGLLDDCSFGPGVTILDTADVVDPNRNLDEESLSDLEM